MTTSRSAIDEQLAGVEAMMAELQAVIASYHHGPVDWDDAEILGHLEEQLIATVRALGSARARADLRRAARRVSVTVRQLAAAKP